MSTYPPSWLVKKTTPLSRHLIEHGFNTCHIDNHMEDIMGFIHWDTNDNLTTSKITYVEMKEEFIAKKWKLFPSLREETRLPQPHGFSQIRM